MRILRHVSEKTLAALVLAGLLGVAAFFALTRTEVGRDELRARIVTSVSERVAGRLEIDHLSGNLVRTFYARGVRLYDPQGRLVAEVDSVVARPRWRAFLQRRALFASLTLFRPDVSLHQRADGTWGLLEALRRDASDPDTPRWTFQATRIEVRGGTATVTSDAPTPAAVERGAVFDYRSLTLRDVDADLAVAAQPGLLQLDAYHVAARPDGPLPPVHDVRGQLVSTADELAVNQLELRVGETWLTLDGALGVADDRWARPLRLDVGEADLRAEDVRAFVPAYPVRDALQLRLRAQGPLSALVVDRLELEHGASRVHGGGTVLGLPEMLDVQWALDDARVAAPDLRALLPAVDWSRLASVGPQRGTLYVEAAVPLGAPEADVAVDGRATLTGRAGTADARVEAKRQDGRWRYRTELSFDDLDPGAWLAEPALAGRLQGRLTADGHAADALADPTASGTLTLGPGRLAGRRVDSASVRLQTAAGAIDWSARAARLGGRLATRGRVDLRAPGRPLTAELVLSHADLGPLLRADSLATDYTARAELDVRGTAWSDLVADLEVAVSPSRVTWGRRDRALPAHRMSVRLDHLEGLDRLVVRNDGGTATLTGTLEPRRLQRFAEAWGAALTAEARAVWDKPMPAADAPIPDAPDGDGDAEPAPPLPASGAPDVPGALGAPGAPEVDVALTLSIDDTRLLSGYVPGRAARARGLEATLGVTGDQASLHVVAEATMDTVRVGAVVAEAVGVSARTDVRRGAPLADGLAADFALRASDLWAGTVHVASPTLTLDAGDGRVTLAAAADRGRSVGPLDLAATLDLAPDVNRLTLHRLYAEAGNLAWAAAGTPEVDLYRDGVVVPHLALQRVSETGAARERVEVTGRLSGAPGDTLSLRAEQVTLAPLGIFAGWHRPLGGQVDGRVALTFTDGRPELTGAVTVGALAFDGRLLGDVSIRSRYRPGRPDIGLELALRPSAAAPDGLRAEPSDLDLTGSFRLPRTTGPARDDGALDLRLDVRRADLFFFEYIFRPLTDVAGSAAGRGTIGGTWRDPRFDADVRIADGRFRVPRFDLAYQVDGRVTIDDAGFHVHDALLADAAGGQAVVNGGILFNDYEYFSFDLAARLNELQVMNVQQSFDLPFYGQIQASGDASLTGPIYATELRSTNVRTTVESELYIPVTEGTAAVEEGFILYADSLGRLPEPRAPRSSILDRRPAGERTFLDGMDLDLNIEAPSGSTVHLVIDPLVGDVIDAVGRGRVQLERREGAFLTYGTFEIERGEYLFTAGEVFTRRFELERGGTLVWDGDPLDARLDIPAVYATRASRAGLPEGLRDRSQSLIPLVVQLSITGRVTAPEVDLSLAIDRSQRQAIDSYQQLEAALNQPERATEYATSVLLTNSFLLSTDRATSEALSSSAFNSLSQLVSNQLNRYLSQALPNVDVQLGVQGEDSQDFDVTYGVALRLLDQRLIIRGQGVYQASRDDARTAAAATQGEFVVEVRLSEQVSVEVFYRREGDVLSETASLTNTTGAGVSYETRFTSWRSFVRHLFGRDADAAPAATDGASPPPADD